MQATLQRTETAFSRVAQCTASATVPARPGSHPQIPESTAQNHTLTTLRLNKKMAQYLAHKKDSQIGSFTT